MYAWGVALDVAPPTGKGFPLNYIRHVADACSEEAGKKTKMACAKLLTIRLCAGSCEAFTRARTDQPKHKVSLNFSADHQVPGSTIILSSLVNPCFIYYV